ncbi:NAD(P)-binding domain protein [Ophiocordyceps sinensis CO18]|uniref:NAD(P)-binding domain protein n=1 Tax=Ophiocordyceps sinensis (strain Co18 / CGMCC 3.14243) TaxID=911162 RepID=T5AEX3_OPHSC|nr:NAD(P)-binding domain protein [Ophiocordyceps sinensis CO18]
MSASKHAPGALQFSSSRSAGVACNLSVGTRKRKARKPVESSSACRGSRITALRTAERRPSARAQAGSIQNQWKIDHDLNVELARAAKQAGVGTFVFVSSGGTRGLVSSMAPYSKMKNGVEDVVRDLGFDQAVILKPGVILGQREQGRLVEGIAQTVARGLGKLGAGVQDMIGQDADVIARAAVRAAQLAAQGKAPSKYWVVEASEIVRLGRTEWPAAPAAAPEKPAAS